MPNLLIVYRYAQFPPRITIKDHLYSFRRYSDWNCFYVNMATQSVPRALWGVRFDAILFHTTFLSARWAPELFAAVAEKTLWLRDLPALRIAMPQDEFIHTDILCDFLNAIGVDVIFSVSPESEWPKIYASIDRSKTVIRQVLTGYLEDRTIARINRLSRGVKARPIDVGYRAWRAAPWLGRHGYLKAQIDGAFRREAPKAGLVVDISTREEDTLLGDAWYRFLLRCKYTIGVEGGASILDRDGAIKKRTEEYQRAHPDASFDEIEAACFPGIDGSFKLFAISPRHLEACATRTCQVLIEGDYNGILRPNDHYIPVRKDLSNLADAMETVRRDDARGAITERAYRDIVASGAYTYRQMVSTVIGEAASLRRPERRSIAARGHARFACARARVSDRLSWTVPVVYRTVLAPAKRRLSRFVPARLVRRAVRMVRRRLGIPQ